MLILAIYLNLFGSGCMTVATDMKQEKFTKMRNRDSIYVVVLCVQCCRAFALPRYNGVSATQARRAAIGRRRRHAWLTIDAAPQLAEHLLAGWHTYYVGCNKLWDVWTLHTEGNAVSRQIFPGHSYICPLPLSLFLTICKPYLSACFTRS